MLRVLYSETHSSSLTERIIQTKKPIRTQIDVCLNEVSIWNIKDRLSWRRWMLRCIWYAIIRNQWYILQSHIIYQHEKKTIMHTLIYIYFNVMAFFAHFQNSISRFIGWCWRKKNCADKYFNAIWLAYLIIRNWK